MIAQYINDVSTKPANLGIYNRLIISIKFVVTLSLVYNTRGRLVPIDIAVTYIYLEKAYVRFLITMVTFSILYGNQRSFRQPVVR